MREIDKHIQTALSDPKQPLEKRLLLYRRKWDGQAFVIESAPIDISAYVLQTGRVKLKLDADEINRWDISNVPFTLRNERNQFKQGREGGLFPEPYRLYGSKFDYQIGACGKFTSVFTGYLTEPPSFDDEAQKIEITLTSRMDQLNYVSAENACQYITSESAQRTADDDGKNVHFLTANKGVAGVSNVAYNGISLQEGSGYSVTDLNEYDKPASITLKIPEVENAQLLVDYTYWYRDLKISEAVHLLLDLSEVEKRDVREVLLDNVETDFSLFENISVQGLSKVVTDNDGTISLEPYIGYWGQGTIVWGDSLYGTPTYRKQALDFVSGLRGYVNLASPRFWYTANANGSSAAWFSFYFLDEDGNGIKIFQKNGYQEIGQIIDGLYSKMASFNIGGYGGLVGFGIDKDNVLYSYGAYTNGKTALQHVGRTTCGKLGFAPKHFVRNSLEMAGPNYDNANLFVATWLNWCEHLPTEQVLNEHGWFDDFISRVFENSEFKLPTVRFDLTAPPEFKSWGWLYGRKESFKKGQCAFYFSDSDDGVNFSALKEVPLGSPIPSAKKHLRLYFRTLTAYEAYEKASGVKVTYYRMGANTALSLTLYNFEGLSVFDALEKLALLSSFMIGFSQDDVFFFKPRENMSTDISMDDTRITEILGPQTDTSRLYNMVRLKEGDYSITISDRTEGKPRPDSMDIYGERLKEISIDHLLPSTPVLNLICPRLYAFMSVVREKLTLEGRINLKLELGDTIRIYHGVAAFAHPSWSDYRKNEALNAWGGAYRVEGIEIDFDKRKMRLDLASA